ncbi:MAG: TonB-dependent receptor plug domain-containing protein, partial [Nitrospiraceae bacterium]|nr:TonB-dependent receptor plug domain-containing protein [Nitrospiraceae bacterium]
MIQHPIRGRLFIAIVLFVGLLWDMGAQAQDEVMDLDIPGQALSSALKTFADQADLQLLYESEVVEGRQTTGVMGRFTSQEALRRLLSGTGTGLIYSFTDANTVTLQKPNPSQAAVGEEADDAEARDFRQKPIKLPEVIVKEVRERDDATSYVAEEANTATRTDTPLIQVPQSIQVATRKLMDDQKAIRVEQALRNVSGVALGDIGQSGIAADVAYCRGFPCGYFKNYLRNEDQNQVLTFRDIANIQRIEVLKGPASVLYGRSEPGGIINILTKQPLPDRYASVDQIIGSYNYYRTMIDATGPLNASKT